MISKTSTRPDGDPSPLRSVVRTVTLDGGVRGFDPPQGVVDILTGSPPLDSWKVRFRVIDTRTVTGVKGVLTGPGGGVPKGCSVGRDETLG